MRALAITCSLLAAVAAQDPVPGRRTQNVVLVTLDGLRWQEVFRGADPLLIDKEQGVADLLATRRRFSRGDPVAARAALLPFLWQVVAVEGQLYGDPDRGARATVQNPHRFSYPGYSELLCGVVDPRIDSNNKFPNPNQSVLEFLAARPGFGGAVAAFSGWDVHPSILARGRSPIFVECEYEPITVAPSAERRADLQRFADYLPRYWSGFCWDALTFARAMAYLERETPRVLYLALGETDEWAHARRYDLYLQMAWTADGMLRELWQWLQRHERYRGTTSLVITVDHGRGRTPRDWTDHGAKVEGAEEVWMAVLGPDTPALGVREGVQVSLAMVAATVAELLGEDFRAAVPDAAPSLPLGRR